MGWSGGLEWAARWTTHPRTLGFSEGSIADGVGGGVVTVFLRGESELCVLTLSCATSRGVAWSRVGCDRSARLQLPGFPACAEQPHAPYPLARATRSIRQGSPEKRNQRGVLLCALCIRRGDFL